MSEYVLVKNRNRSDLPVEMLEFLGASDERGLTGQGFGTKFAATLARAKNLRVIRASYDGGKNQDYVCRFVDVPQVIRGKNEPKMALDITWGDANEELRETSMLVRMATNSWGEHPLGDSYAILREIVLDAADEDDDFSVEIVNQGDIGFAPRGWTYSYVTATEELKLLVKYFGYYFKRLEHCKWLSKRVAIAPRSTSDGECRIFVTAENAPIAYAAYSTGDGYGLPAFDYIISESDGEKLVSMPKRLLEKAERVEDLILTAMRNTDDVDAVAGFLKSYEGGGWEKRRISVDAAWWRNKAVVKAAIQKNWPDPLVRNGSQAEYEANATGQDVSSVSDAIYALGRKMGVMTGYDVLAGVVDPDAVANVPLSRDERHLVLLALEKLDKTFGRDMSYDHMFMRREGGDMAGEHDPDYGGEDVIAINFGKMPGYWEGDRKVTWTARIIVHELGHHVSDDRDDYWHSVSYVNGLIDLLIQ